MAKTLSLKDIMHILKVSKETLSEKYGVLTSLSLGPMSGMNIRVRAI